MASVMAENTLHAEQQHSGASSQLPDVQLEVARATSVSMAALLAQANLPFVIEHDLAHRLHWSEFCGSSAVEFLQDSSVAQSSTWYAMLSPDGVVGQYDRKRWSVDVTINSLEEHDRKVQEYNADLQSIQNARQSSVVLRWCSCDRKNAEPPQSCLHPRHLTTPDINLQDALGLWSSSQLSLEALGFSEPWWTGVYLRGAVPEAQASIFLKSSIFDALQETAVFGSASFASTLYLSHEGLQTNLHADEHSGFLVQLGGRKRVVLFDKAASKQLRCSSWGDLDAPVNRRSWFDCGIPDIPQWWTRPPFQGLRFREIEVGPGEALYIPKGYFHDVLSRTPETFGLVLRCQG